MYRFLLLSLLLLAACAPAAPKVDYDCKAHYEDFSTYFEEKEFLDWCKECVRTGVPSDSYDAGPFCNTVTGDGGKACSDRAECEGYCVTTGIYATSGECSATMQLEDGCHWILTEGTATELCVS